MSYRMFNTYAIADKILDESKKTSYRAVSDRFKSSQGYSISPSKLCRIANRKQDCSIKDLEAIMNVYNLCPDDVITTFPF